MAASSTTQERQVTLSAAQDKALRELVAQGETGAAERTVKALIQKGLAVVADEGLTVTDAGREAVGDDATEEPPAEEPQEAAEAPAAAGKGKGKRKPAEAAQADDRPRSKALRVPPAVRRFILAAEKVKGGKKATEALASLQAKLADVKGDDAPRLPMSDDEIATLYDLCIVLRSEGGTRSEVQQAVGRIRFIDMARAGKTQWRTVVL